MPEDCPAVSFQYSILDRKRMESKPWFKPGINFMNPLLPSCFGGSGQTYSVGDNDSDEESKEPTSALPKHLKEVDP